MAGLVPTNDEGIDKKSIEDIKQSKVSCQVCGIEFAEGERLTAYCVRPADTLFFAVASVTCRECAPVPRERFTLTADEVVVEGRVGRCVDVTTQSSWLVVLAATPRARSTAGTTHATPCFDRPGVAHTPHDHTALRARRGDGT